MAPTLSNNCAPTDTPRWQQGWLDAFPCDMPSSVPYPRIPLYTLLEHVASRFPNRPGCTIYGTPTSYAQLAEQSRRFASALKDMGAGPGKFVGLLLPNIPEYLVALQAVWLTGATVLQLSPLMVHEEVAHWLKATDCRIVVTLDLLAPIVTPLLGHRYGWDTAVVVACAICGAGGLLWLGITPAAGEEPPPEPEASW